MKNISFRLVSPKDLVPQEKNGNGDAIWNTEKEDFISTATHQLRSPLVGMKWTLDMILSNEVGKVTVEQKKWLKGAYKSNERVIEMVDDMLNAMRVDSGVIKFMRTKINLKVLITSLVDELKAAAQEKKIKIKLSIDKKIKPLMGDEEKLRVALQNLVHNAIKYTPEKGKVNISISEETGKVKIVIEDTGIGIPEAERKDVFRRFFRGSNAMLSDEAGTGLGLYITKNVIERHGGRIWFDTELKKGTTFYILMPYDGLKQ